MVKLFILGDNHLQWEGWNYQLFPAHFFGHWTEYNPIHPITHPVPLGAFVLQFYGPCQRSPRRDGWVTNQIWTVEDNFSPILFIKDCGIPVDTTKLNVTNKTDCVSLVYQFHEENWIHASLNKWNIVMQPGPLRQWPASWPVRKINVF